VREHGNFVVNNLKWVNGGDNGRRFRHDVELAGDSELKVGVTSPFAHSPSFQVHGNRTDKHKINGRHLGWVDEFADFESALDS
jgi:hypothetical protein